jgi:UDP-N-acetylglucosamine transferase subunit ALG13/putative flippase GtrA
MVVGSIRSKKMILITLGTQDKEFTRILKEVDKLITKKVIKEEVVVQAGYTKYKSKNMKIFDYVSKTELEKYIEKASFVITHAGVGTIFDCLNKNKKIIAVPRLSKYKEHNNDHQLQIVEEFGKEGFLIPVYEMDELEQAIQKVKTFKPNKYKSNNKNMVKLISEYIDRNEKRSMIKTIKELFNKYREIIMYLIFGVLTTVVSLAVYYILVYTILNPNNPFELQVANIISWIAGVAFAYFTNRSMVFQSKNKNKLKEAGSFVLARVVTLIMDMLIMFVGVTLLHGNDKLLKLISQVIVIVSNYVFSKLFVFKK